MKSLSAMAVCLLLVGCDYSVPLVKEPAVPIDRGLVGLWERAQENEKPDRLLVLPLGAREYLVAFPATSPDGMFARATLAPQAGLKLVQIDWVGTARGAVPETNRVFQFATYVVTGDVLEVRMLNAEIVQRDVASAKDLARRIEEQRDNPDLFKPSMRFKSVKSM